MARTINKAEFNFVMLILSALGFLQVLDLGFAKAVTRIVAQDSKSENINTAVGNALFISGTIGFSFALIVSFISSWFTKFSLTTEVRHAGLAISYAAFSIPLYLCTSIIQGYFDGKIDVYKANILKALSASLLVVVPFLLLIVDKSALTVSIGFFISRLITLAIAAFFAKRSKLKPTVRLKEHRAITEFGGWLTVSNLASPVMSIGDKYYLSSIFPPGLVAQYSIANEAVMRLNIFPGALGRALFPIISKLQKAKKELKVAYSIVLGFGFFFILPMSLFSSDIVNLWLGRDYIEMTSKYLRILLVGLFFVSLSQIPYGFIQAKRGTKATAVIHLVELPIYVGSLIIAVRHWGIEGAAYAWTGRLILDFIFLQTYHWTIRND
jgi:O-antigen/teichoic acid export membrane protein